MEDHQSNQQDILTNLILNIFRVNARLLEKGDQLVAPIGMTSARWQVLGAIALSEEALTCPRIASVMGISRQGALKQLNLAVKQGLIAVIVNPHHGRSPLYKLTRLGKKLYEESMRIQKVWGKDLLKGITLKDLKTALDVLCTLEARLLTPKSITPFPCCKA